MKKAKETPKPIEPITAFKVIENAIAERETRLAKLREEARHVQEQIDQLRSEATRLGRG